MIPEVSAVAENQIALMVHVIERKTSVDINYSKNDSKIANTMTKSCNAF